MTFAYCALPREQVRAMRISDPTLIVVLRGCKEIWQGSRIERYHAGELFLLPAGTTIDVVNIPDEGSGLYEATCLRIDANLRRALRHQSARSSARRALSSPLGSRIELTPDLVEAFGRAAAVLDTNGAARLAQHRVLEILLLLETNGVESLSAISMAEHVERLVLEEPAYPWMLGETARLLATSAATLRRKLSAEGTSFRTVLLQVRMAQAEKMLREGRSTVNDAAQAAGYASRSHFARRYRAAYGMRPNSARQQVSTQR